MQQDFSSSEVTQLRRPAPDALGRLAAGDSVAPGAEPEDWSLRLLPGVCGVGIVEGCHGGPLFPDRRRERLSVRRVGDRSPASQRLPGSPVDPELLHIRGTTPVAHSDLARHDGAAPGAEAVGSALDERSGVRYGKLFCASHAPLSVTSFPLPRPRLSIDLTAPAPAPIC